MAEGETLILESESVSLDGIPMGGWSIDAVCISIRGKLQRDETKHAAVIAYNRRKEVKDGKGDCWKERAPEPTLVIPNRIRLNATSQLFAPWRSKSETFDAVWLLHPMPMRAHSAAGSGSICNGPSLAESTPMITPVGPTLPDITAADARRWRMLFVPQFAFDDVAKLDADAIIVDFQDAVPLSAKAAARKGLRDALEAGYLRSCPVIVRINERALVLEQHRDLDALVGCPHVSVLMPTMVERPSDLDQLHESLLFHEQRVGIALGSYRFIVLIETPAAFARIHAIAASGGGRIIGLLLGGGDFFRLTGAVIDSDTTIDYPRNKLIMAARANGLAAYDTPYTSLRDPIGLEQDALQAKRHGFDGKACLHPNQLAIVDRCLRPTLTELTWARRIEHVRKHGDLRTMSRRVLGSKANPEADRNTDGMAIVDGQLVGPPHIKAAQRLLAREPVSPPHTDTECVRGRVVSHQLQRAYGVGAELENPYELTITSGMRDAWVQAFYTHDPAATSVPYATQLGLSDGVRMPCPFQMALYLAVSMSATHGAIYHLGFRQGRQHAPVLVGDTIRQRIRMRSIRNTRCGKRAVVTTSRELVRLSDDAVLFSVDKLELYRVQPADLGSPSPFVQDAADPEADARWSTLAKGSQEATAERSHIPGLGRSHERFSAGELLLHTLARPMGISTNLALSTLFLVTHPIHLDHHAHDLGTGHGIVVSGGLVISQMLGAVRRDLTHIIWEQLVSANNIRPLAPTDTLGAVSYIIASRSIAGRPDLEVLTVKSLGIKNISPSRELLGRGLPLSLFGRKRLGAAGYDALCRQHEAMHLEGLIVCDAVRHIVRVCSASL